MFKPQYSLLPDIAIGRKVTLPVSPPQSERYPLLYNSFKQTAKKEICMRVRKFGFHKLKG